MVVCRFYGQACPMLAIFLLRTGYDELPVGCGVRIYMGYVYRVAQKKLANFVSQLIGWPRSMCDGAHKVS